MQTINKTDSTITIDQLPPEIWHEVFCFFDWKTLKITSQTCQLFQQIAKKESLYKQLCEKEWTTLLPKVAYATTFRSWKWLLQVREVLYLLTVSYLLEQVFK
jgi:hypothetical protein